MFIAAKTFIRPHSPCFTLDYSLGAIDISTVAKVIKEVSESEKKRLALLEARPPLESIVNLHDLEVVAKGVLTDKAWVRIYVQSSVKNPSFTIA